MAPGQVKALVKASVWGGGRQRKEGWDYVGESLLIPEHLTSVEVLWFHQPRLRSVRPGAPSHILWYVLLPPPKPSLLPGSPDGTRRSHRQPRTAVVVSHVSSSTSSGWLHLCFFLRWSRTFGLLCSRWRLRRSNKACALKQPARHLKAQSARFPTRPYYVISANWESSGNEKISWWFRWWWCFFFLSLSDVKHLLELICKSLTNSFMFRLQLPVREAGTIQLLGWGRNNSLPAGNKSAWSTRYVKYEVQVFLCVLVNIGRLVESYFFLKQKGSVLRAGDHLDSQLKRFLLKATRMSQVWNWTRLQVLRIDSIACLCQIRNAIGNIAECAFKYLYCQQRWVPVPSCEL